MPREWLSSGAACRCADGGRDASQAWCIGAVDALGAWTQRGRIRSWRRARDGTGAPAAQMQEHMRSDARSASDGGRASAAMRCRRPERKCLAHDSVEHRPAYAGGARGFERRRAAARRSHARPLERSRGRKQSGTDARRPPRPPRCAGRRAPHPPGHAAGQSMEHFRAEVTMRAVPVGHREHDFHPITGGEIRRAPAVPSDAAQCREALRVVVFGKGEPGDVIRAGVAIREAHDADLVHRANHHHGRGLVCHRIVTGCLGRLALQIRMLGVAPPARGSESHPEALDRRAAGGP